MNYLKLISAWIFSISITTLNLQAQSASGADKQALAKEVNPGLMIRIAEIEILPQFLTAYKGILTKESGASVELEPGVISIFPMYQKSDSTLIRIVEIYADRAAYEHHLTTPHFKLYKTSTANMVKSLKLIDMESLDPLSMSKIFRKLQ
ncbi:MAG: antibiotic biosynthesis monooxygenase [Flavitalea sp.]